MLLPGTNSGIWKLSQLDEACLGANNRKGLVRGRDFGQLSSNFAASYLANDDGLGSRLSPQYLRLTVPFANGLQFGSQFCERYG